MSGMGDVNSKSAIHAVEDFHSNARKTVIIPALWLNATYRDTPPKVTSLKFEDRPASVSPVQCPPFPLRVAICSAAD